MHRRSVYYTAVDVLFPCCSLEESAPAWLPAHGRGQRGLSQRRSVPWDTVPLPAESTAALPPGFRGHNWKHMWETKQMSKEEYTQKHWAQRQTWMWRCEGCTRWGKQQRVEAMQGGHEKRKGNPKIQTVLTQTGALKDENKTSWKEILAFLLACEPEECCSSWRWAWRKDRDPESATSP